LLQAFRSSPAWVSPVSRFNAVKSVFVTTFAGTRPRSAAYFLAYPTKILREKLSMECQMSVRLAQHLHTFLPACDYHIQVLFVLTVLALVKISATAPATTAMQGAKGTDLAANG